MKLDVPIVQAPLAGGSSTPALSAAVAAAGGLGFLAAGYRSAEAMASDLAELRRLSDRPFGVNLFAPTGAPADPAAVAAYAERLRPEAVRAGVELGEPRFDDDGFEAKLEVLRADPPAVVSFTFGCPAPELVAELRDRGAEVWVTVTNPADGRLAATAGADALVAQGVEAGGHRGSFDDREGEAEIALLPLLSLLRPTGLPLIAAGGIADDAAVAAVLAAGAVAAQVGTALMLTPEAGTATVHREAIRSERPTALTRAFSGRRARGIVNRVLAEHGDAAPSAYPEVHHLTVPLRAHGREHGDGDLVNLWAGQAHALAREEPAGETVARLAPSA